MKAALLLCLATFSAAAFAQQTPGAQSRTYTSDLGFSYTLPADWEAVEPPAPPANPDAKGLACVKMTLSARHGTPASVIVEAALPYKCYGQDMTEGDLPGFAASASQGLSENFDIGEPVTSTYKLGTHSVWIERVKGTPKSAPSIQYTIEIACTPLKKAAACWILFAADEAALGTFEAGNVKLDGDAPQPLVPASAFGKKD
jgi:hypothetical protein